MQLITTYFDIANCKFYINSNTNRNIENCSIVISDVHLDCAYYVIEGLTISTGFDCWIVPITNKLINIISQSETFPGFSVKLYGPNKRLLQVEQFRMNNVPPIINRMYATPTHDAVGPSYIDFFFGDLCIGMDVTGVVIDAGANVGFFTLFAKENGAKRIYSVEPDILPYSFLEANFKHDSSVITINKALNSKNQLVDFNISLTSSVGSAMSDYTPMYDNMLPTTVESISLHDILRIEPVINMLKLDIEGAEYDVLDELSGKCFRSINQFFIEFHRDPKPIFDRLVAEGYHAEYRHSTENDFAGFIYAKKI